MEYTTNLDGIEGSRFVLGRVGFDVITLGGFDLPTIFEEPIYEHNPFLEEAYDMQTHDGASCTKRKITICGKGYELKFGNLKNRAFMNLTIHANKGDGNNLVNMLVEDVWERIAEIDADIYLRFAMHLPMNRNMLRIMDAEINQTFPTEHEFTKYQRVFSLLSYALNQKKTGVKGEAHGEISRWKQGVEKKETFYLMKGTTTEVICYDKVAELCMKLKRQLDFEEPLMRVEIKSLEQNLAKLMCSADSTQINSQQEKVVYLARVTNDSVTSFFSDYFKKAFEIVDEYLKEQMNFSVKYASRAGGKNLFKMMNTAILQVLRRGMEEFCENIVEEYFSSEVSTGLPVLLDLKDLIKAFRGTPLDENNTELIVEQLKLIDDEPEKYKKCCATFIGQRHLYEELYKKITKPQMSQWVYFDSKRAMKLGSNAHIRYMDTVEENIYQTSHTPHMYYRKEEHGETWQDKCGPVHRKVNVIHYEFFAEEPVDEEFEAYIEQMARDSEERKWSEGVDGNFYGSGYSGSRF